MPVMLQTLDPKSASASATYGGSIVVAEAGTIIANRLAMDQKWRQLFSNEEGSAFRAAIERSPPT
jgi:hypothetical protein